MPEPRLELTINSRDGIFIRSVPQSEPLPASDTHGHAAEEAVVSAMSIHGLQDFAFPSSTIPLGSGVRELGDGLLVTYPLAAVIQVKGRPNSTQDAERETRWLIKNIEKAKRQIDGTLRALEAGPLTRTNMRGTPIPIDASQHEWLGVVIVEHDDIPEGFIPAPLNQRGIILTRADWEFLWAQLQSTVEVLKYIHRIGALPPVPLGQESVRYYQAALLDEDAQLEPLPEAWRALGGTRVSGPLLPLAPAGQVVEHFVIRQIVEDLAVGDIPQDLDREKLLRAFSALDGISVSQRDQMGADLLANVYAVSEDSEDHRIWTRTILSPTPGTPQILFMTYNRQIDDIGKALLTARVELSHDNWLRSGVHNSSNLTVGVLLTPSSHPQRPWDVTMAVLDTLDMLSDEERAEREIRLS